MTKPRRHPIAPCSSTRRTASPPWPSSAQPAAPQSRHPLHFNVRTRSREFDAGSPPSSRLYTRERERERGTEGGREGRREGEDHHQLEFQARIPKDRRDIVPTVPIHPNHGTNKHIPSSPARTTVVERAGRTNRVALLELQEIDLTRPWPATMAGRVIVCEAIMIQSSELMGKMENARPRGHLWDQQPPSPSLLGTFIQRSEAYIPSRLKGTFVVVGVHVPFARPAFSWTVWSGRNSRRRIAANCSAARTSASGAPPTSPFPY